MLKVSAKVKSNRMKNAYEPIITIEMLSTTRFSSIFKQKFLSLGIELSVLT